MSLVRFNKILKVTTCAILCIFTISSSSMGLSDSFNKTTVRGEYRDTLRMNSTRGGAVDGDIRINLRKASSSGTEKEILSSLLVEYFNDPANQTIRSDIESLMNKLGLIVDPEVLDCFATLKAMNVDIPRRIENGEIEVDVVMNLLASVGKKNVAEVQKDYQATSSVMNRNFRNIDILDNTYDLGDGSGVYQLVKLYLDPKTGIAREPHPDADKKLIIHLLALNAGVGSRDASLTFNSGNVKGEVHMYGDGLSQQNIDQVKALTEGLIRSGVTTGEYFWLFPADNVILPSVDHLKDIYDADHGFYLHTFSWQVIGQNLALLLQWGPPLGQMARKPGNVGDESYDVKRFIEKPDIATLTLSVIANAIEEAGYTEEEFIQKLAESMGITVDELNSRYNNNPLALLVMPMITDEGAWKGMYALDSARAAMDEALEKLGKQASTDEEWEALMEIKDGKAAGHLVKSRAFLQELIGRDVSNQEWMQYYTQAQGAPNAAKELKSQVLDKGGRNSFANTFYFLMSRDFTEEFYKQYEHLWVSTPDKSIRDTEPFGWSALILTPMVTPLTPEDIAAGRDIPEAWSSQFPGSKYESFYTQATWNDMWRKAQALKKAGNGLKGADAPLWIDVGTPQESKEGLMLGVSTADPVRRALYLGLFGHDMPTSDVNVADGTTYGDIEYKGSVRIDPNSLVRVRGGGKLIIGNDVTIEESLVVIDIPEGKTVTIPDETIIASSSIEGSVTGDGEGDYIYRLYSKEGLNFMGKQVQATAFTRDGDKYIHHDVGILVKNVKNHKVPGTDWTYAEFFDGTETGNITESGDKERIPVIDFAKQRQKARELRETIKTSSAGVELDTVRDILMSTPFNKLDISNLESAFSAYRDMLNSDIDITDTMRKNAEAEMSILESLRGVSVVKTDELVGTLVIDDFMIPENQKDAVFALLDNSSQALIELEKRLGCRIRLKSQFDSTKDIISGKVIVVSNREMITLRLDEGVSADIKYFVIGQTNIDGFLPIADLLSFAKGLMILKDVNAQNELVAFLKYKFRALSGKNADDDIMQQMLKFATDQNWKTFVLILPKVEKFDNANYEKMHKMAWLALIAA